MGDPPDAKENVMKTFDLFFHTGDDVFGVVTSTFRDYSLYELYMTQDLEIGNTADLLVEMTNRFFQDRN